MQDRLRARGLAIGMACLVLLLLSPTPVPVVVQQLWQTGAQAAASGDAGAVIKSLSALQATFPWLTELRETEIPLALASDDGRRALDLLGAGAGWRSESMTVACWRAEARVLVGEWEEATAQLPVSFGDACPQLARRLKALAHATLAQLDLEATVAILEATKRLNPGDQEASALLGAALVLIDPAVSIPLLESAAAAGDPMAADLVAALSPVPAEDDPALLAQVGKVFLQHQDWPLAALTFERLAQFDPGNGEAYAFYGLAQQRLGLDGRTAIEQSVRLAPDSPTALSALGLYWQEQGRPLTALPLLRRALELDPANSAFTASLAAAQAASGDVQGALASYRQAAQLSPASPVYWSLLADFSLSREIEVGETGVPAARNALVLQPDAPAFDRLGHAHLLLAHHVPAERLLSQAVRLDPASASARLHYGLLLIALARSSEAEAQLEAAANLGGETSVGELARRALSHLGE